MENITFIDSVKKMPLLELPVRSCLVRLAKAQILISPGSELSPDQLHSLNPVTDIVAPSQLHAAGVAKAARVFPQARIWGPPPLRDLKPHIAWTDPLTKEHWPYQEELAALHLAGMPDVNEVVFVHKQTRTLIVADTCFNLLNAQGPGAWVILHLFGTYRRFGVSRFFARMIKDKKAFQNSIRQLLSYDFDAIVVGHGELIPTNGKNLLIKAFEERNLL